MCLSDYTLVILLLLSFGFKYRFNSKLIIYPSKTDLDFSQRSTYNSFIQLKYL